MNGHSTHKNGLGVTTFLAALAFSFVAIQPATAATRYYSSVKISGSPATTDVAGTPYSFAPTTSGGRSTRSYSIQNKPAWASFSISNGQLAGTPSTAQVGTYSNVTITVTDGRTTASLSPFSIAVTAPVVAPAPAPTPTPTPTPTPAPAPVTTGTATLSWMPPSQNTDGSTLADLAGYSVYYGTSATNLTTKIVVANAGATSFTVSNLASGTYYFGVTAYNTSGIESALSGIGSKTIN